MQHVDGRVLNVSAFPLPSHLSLGRTVLKTLTVVPVLFSPACCFCCLPRLWAGQAAGLGWTWADPWLVASPRAATGALLCPGTSAAFGGLEPLHLQQIHLEGQYCCLLSLDEEEYVKSSYSQQRCKLWITGFNWHLGRCLNPHASTCS